VETFHHMRRFALFAAVALFAVTALAQTKPGLYLDRGEKNFSKLDHAPVAEMGTKGVVKSMFVPGAMPSGIWRFSGKSSPVGTSVHPHFVYRLGSEQDISARDVVMIRLDQHDDHREARIVRMSAWTGNSATGFDKSKIVPLRVTTEHDGFIEFEPSNDLVPNGEYFLTANLSPRGYDFHGDASIPTTNASLLPPDVPSISNPPNMGVTPPAAPVASQPQREVRVEPAALTLAQPAQEQQSLGDAARRAKQHKACLELAKNNPSIICQ